MAPTRARDHTCVPTPELARVFNAYRDKSVPMSLIAERIGMDVRDLKKIVSLGKYRTTGIGANLTSLADTGELTVIPSPGPEAPAKMAEDEFWLEGRVQATRPGPAERRRRAEAFAQLRRDTLAKYP